MVVLLLCIIILISFVRLNGNNEVLILHGCFYLTEYCLLVSLVTYMKIKDINMYKIVAIRHLQNKPSEPAAIIRATLYNRSLCFLFSIFVICFHLLFFVNGEGSNN